MKRHKKTAPTKKTLLRHPDLPAYLLFVAAFVVFFFDILTSRHFLWEDILYQYYPFHYHLFKSLRQFSLPLWNPYMFAGMPFLADIQTQVFYPLNWLLAFISTPSQSSTFYLVQLKCILHLLLGAIGFYLLMREMKLSRWSGVIAGLSFGLSGFMVSHIIHLTIISTFAWFPLLLFFFYRTVFHHRLRDAVLGALTLGLANLAGHPQMSLHIIYALGFLFLLHIVSNWRTERPRLLKLLLPLFLVIIIGGFALTAAAYLPAYTLSRHTVRETMTYMESAETSLPLWFLITLVVPKFFGSFTGTGTDTVPFWAATTTYTYWETCIYIGVLPLLFALIGIGFSRSRLRWHFLILALIAILLALGRFTPFYRFAFEILPGFNRFRIPARFIGLFTITFAFLAGLGVDVVLKNHPKEKRLLVPGLCLLGYVALLALLTLTGLLQKPFPLLVKNPQFTNALNQTGIAFVTVAVALVLLFLANRFPRQQNLIFALLTALTFFDLYRFGHQFSLGDQRPEEFYPRRPLIARLSEEGKQTPFRINARSGNTMFFQRNEGLLWELELLEGYTPLKLLDYVTFEIPPDRRNDLLNVRYRIQIDSARGLVGLAPNPTALPRAWLADSCVVIPDRPAILKLLGDSAFDYRRVVILETEPPPGLRPIPDTLPPGNVTITSRSPHRIEMAVTAARPALLVLSEIYYPEWRAKVNSRPVGILRADYCLRAVPLPAGKHQVVIYYNRNQVVTGMLISKLAFLALVLVLLLPRLTKIKHQNHTQQP